MAAEHLGVRAEVEARGSRRRRARCRCRCRRRSASSRGSRGSRTARSAGSRGGPGRSRSSVATSEQRWAVWWTPRAVDRRALRLRQQVAGPQVVPLGGAIEVGRRSWPECRSGPRAGVEAGADARRGRVAARRPAAEVGDRHLVALDGPAVGVGRQLDRVAPHHSHREGAVAARDRVAAGRWPRSAAAASPTSVWRQPAISSNGEVRHVDVDDDRLGGQVGEHGGHDLGADAWPRCPSAGRRSSRPSPGPRRRTRRPPG